MCSRARLFLSFVLAHVLGHLGFVDTSYELRSITYFFTLLVPLKLSRIRLGLALSGSSRAVVAVGPREEAMIGGMFPCFELWVDGTG